MEERIQKIIARAGLASRRRAEEMMTSGLVTVNGRIVTELGSKADASRDHIKVAGKLLQPESFERVYFVLHKPPEIVSTLSDPEGRPSLRDLLYGISERVFPVGRLEYHSSGLVFLTNDGDLANRILQTHNLPQTYQLKLKTLLTFEEIENLTRSTGARISRIRGKDSPWYEVTLAGVRSDALRNKLFKTGHLVEKMKRTRIANLELDSLAPGTHRPLRPVEIAELKQALDAQPAAGKAEARKPEERKPEWRRPTSAELPGAKPASERPATRESADQAPIQPTRMDPQPPEDGRQWGKRPWQKPAERGRPANAAAGKPAWHGPKDSRASHPSRMEHKPPQGGQQWGKRPWQKPANGDREAGRFAEGKTWQKAGERRPSDSNRTEGKPPQGGREWGKRPWQKPAEGGRPADRVAGGKPTWQKPRESAPFNPKRTDHRSTEGKPWQKSASGKPMDRNSGEHRPAASKPAWKKSASSGPSGHRPKGFKPTGRKSAHGGPMDRKPRKFPRPPAS